MTVTNFSSPTAVSGKPAASAGGIQSDDVGRETFLKLLVAQIRSQDPLNPQDPTQFVSQLAQFSELEQMIEIRDILRGIAGFANVVELP